MLYGRTGAIEERSRSVSQVSTRRTIPVRVETDAGDKANKEVIPECNVANEQQMGAPTSIFDRPPSNPSNIESQADQASFDLSMEKVVSKF